MEFDCLEILPGWPTETCESDRTIRREEETPHSRDSNQMYFSAGMYSMAKHNCVVEWSSREPPRTAVEREGDVAVLLPPKYFFGTQNELRAKS